MKKLRLTEEGPRKSYFKGKPWYEVVACIDGRGFRQRRADMRVLILRLNGKVFTASTLDHLIAHTKISRFVSK